jgi:hypothetical protein
MKRHYTEEERNNRDERISMEAIVDAYDEEEQMLGWHAYLEQKIQFPFTARCIKESITAPLKVGDEVKVVRMAPDLKCLHDMLVIIKWKKLQFGVPLSQLEGVKVDEETQEAIEDWHYWVHQDDDDDYDETEDEEE